MTSVALRLPAAAGATRHRRAPLWASLLLAAQAIAAEIDYDVIGVRRLPIVVLILMTPIALVALRSPTLPRALWSRPVRGFTIAIAWGLLTIAWSVVPSSTTRAMLSIVGLFVFAVWYVTEFGFARFTHVYVGSMAGVLTAGFIRDLIIVLGSDTIHRFDGYGVHATDLARLALVTVVLATVQIVERISRHWVMWWGLVIGTVSLVATGTRTTLIALVLCLFVVSWRTLGLGRTVLIGVVMAAGLAVAFSSVPDPSKFVARDEQGRDITSVSGRLTIWSVAVDLTRDSPVVGHGVASGELLFPRASAAGDLPVLIISHAHNMLLEITVTQGLIGLALTGIALTGYFTARAAPDGRLSSVILIAILLSGVTEAILGRPSALYLVIGALYAERAAVFNSSRARARAWA